MKTLTLNHEDTKDQRREAYVPNQQDHGSAPASKRPSKRHYRDYFTKTRADILSQDLERAATEEALDYLNPRQLEAAATALLASDVELEMFRTEAGTIAYSADTKHSDRFTSDDPPEMPKDLDDYERPDLDDSSLATAEFMGSLLAGKQVRADAERLYEGISHEDHAEFIDGFTITTRL